MFRENNLSFAFSKERVNEETAALMGELLFLGENTNNNLKFREVGLNSNFDKILETTKIKEGIAKDLSADNIELMRGAVGVLTSFVAAPIFTDDFDLDHGSRQKWEALVGLRKNNGQGQVSDLAKDYYHANRLGFNRCSAVVGLISNLAENIVDQNLKTRFQELIKEIPLEFLEKDENNNYKYHGLAAAEKIRVVEKLSEVAREVIFFSKSLVSLIICFLSS